MMDSPSRSSLDDAEVQENLDKAIELMEADPLSPEAVSLLRRNAGKGCTASMVRLGLAFADGDDGQRKESFERLRKAAESGDPSGMRNLAYCYAIGLNCEKDKAKGADLYRKAAEMGNAVAMCNLGVMLSYGNGVEKDMEEAFRWYLRSAEGGCSRGMTNVGELYLWGSGTEKNVDEAEKWFRRSGSPRADFRLAEVLLDERGDVEEGMFFLRRSAERGYSRGLYRYGRVLEPDDPEKAAEMYSLAAAKGNKDAASRLEELGRPVPASSMPRKKKRKS